MKYIRIANQGEIELNAFRLIGASSKRNDDTKIGFFGSGLKYGMAFMLREKIGFKIFSGKDEIVVSTKTVKHRDQDFEMIQVNGEDTSMTTEMGPKWSHWGAVREVYCNAIDEGDDTITIVDEADVQPQPGSTVFYIQLGSSELTSIIDNWDMYFSKDRTDIVHKHELGDGACTIFWPKGEDLVIYRKGIQCWLNPNTKCCFHYDFPWIEINESREIESHYFFKMAIVKFIFQHFPANALKILLEQMDTRVGTAEWEYYLPWNDCGYKPNTAAWVEATAGKILVPAEIAGWFTDKVDRDPHKYLLLPSKLVAKIQKNIPEIETLGNVSDNITYTEIEPNEKQKFLIGEVMRFFQETEYAVDYPVKVVKFKDNYILGHAKNEQILISETVFEQGRRKLAETIYEENEHIKTSFNDETRAFQDHLIGQVISRMEEKHAFFL